MNQESRLAIRLLLTRSRGFWLVNTVNLGDNIAYFLILTLLTLFLGELGWSDQRAGLTVSVYMGLVTITMLWGGRVSDRLGVGRAITVSMVITSLGRTLLAAATALGWWAAVAGLLIAAFGSGISQPALYTGVKVHAEPRAASLGYSILYATLSLGIGVGSFLSPLVRTGAAFGPIHGLGLGITGVFWVAALLSWATVGFHLAFYQPPATAEAGEVAEVSGGFDARFLFFIFILLPVRTLFAHQFLTLPSYVFRTFPVSVSDRFEWLMGINPPIVLVLVPLFTLWTRRVHIVDVMIAGTGLTALTTFCLAGPPRLANLLFYIVVFSVGEAMWGSRFLEYVAEIAPPGRLGAYMGMAGIPWFCAKFTTGLYSGWMLDHFVPLHGPARPETLWFIYALVALITPVSLVVARRWLTKNQGISPA
ncbi:MAG: MFS transporter [Candidatus Eremiobacteraeota bacterium]|nr:MFS transporter [Candidatus Eremiobacteraeota bacterium]